MKIAGITTVAGVGPDPKPPTDVAEPSSLAVLASFGLFAAWRRRKSA
ncbi:PEP-CTERM sorting domain-containing protein [Paraglaciecola sp. Hal342]